MQIRAEEISQIIQKQIEGFDASVELAETGSVISVGDGIARIYGLEKCMAGELLEFPGDLMGMALNLETDNVGAVLLGDDRYVKEGDEVRRVVHRTVFLERGDHLRHRRALLTDANVDAVNVGVPLVDDGVDGDGRGLPPAFDDGKRGQRAAPQVVAQLGRALEKPRVEIEHVARISLAARRATQ